MLRYPFPKSQFRANVLCLIAVDALTFGLLFWAIFGKPPYSIFGHIHILVPVAGVATCLMVVDNTEDEAWNLYTGLLGFVLFLWVGMFVGPMVGHWEGFSRSDWTGSNWAMIGLLSPGFIWALVTIWPRPVTPEIHESQRSILKRKIGDLCLDCMGPEGYRYRNRLHDAIDRVAAAEAALPQVMAEFLASMEGGEEKESLD